MDSKTVVSAKGQIVIPKLMREAMGLHLGTELIVHLREDNTLEFKPVKRSLDDFFGKGAGKIREDSIKTSPLDVDETITEAVQDNNPSPRSDA